MVFASQSDPDQQDVAQLEAAMSSAREQFNKGMDENEDIPAELRDGLKAAASDWFDAFTATVKTGQVDGGASLHASADSISLVAGVLVKDTAKFESGLKKLESAAKETHKEFPGIQWNAASHAGVNFHTLSVPVPADKEAPRKLLGETVDIAFGVGPEAVYLAAGRDNIQAVKKAIDASAAEPEKKCRHLSWLFHWGRWLNSLPPRRMRGRKRRPPRRLPICSAPKVKAAITCGSPAR